MPTTLRSPATVANISQPAADTLINPDLTADDQYRVRRIIESQYSLSPNFVKDPLKYEMKICLTSEVPITTATRRLSIEDKKRLQQMINELLSEGRIRPSHLNYASAVVLVKKKNGETRMCIDYRGLNKITARDNYPLPLIDDCLLYLSNKKFFSLIDLKSAFNQISMHPDSIKFTAFVTPMGQYEYVVMPFGLKNSPAVFQRFINEIFRNIIDDMKIVIYMNDILIAAETIDEHIDLLFVVLDRCCRRGLELNLSKSKFAFTELVFLGYSVSEKGIAMTDERIRAIAEYPLPTDQKKLLSVLCLFNYLRRFIENYSLLAEPLHKLLKGEFVVFTLRRFIERIWSLSDAAKGRRIPSSGVFSRRTTPEESRYHSFELETLAVINSLRHFHTYLHGI